MLRWSPEIAALERELIRREPLDYEANLRQVEGIIELARQVGSWPPADPLEGLDVDIRLAQVFHAYDAARQARPRSG